MKPLPASAGRWLAFLGYPVSAVFACVWAACTPAPIVTAPSFHAEASPEAGTTAAVPNAEGRARPHPELLRQMHEQLGQSLMLESAIVRGDLATVRALSASLERTVATGEGFRVVGPSFDGVRAAVTGLRGALTLPTAAVAFGELAGACGACHAELGAKITWPTLDPPPRGGEPAATMRAHVWAATRMWEGIVAPDPDRWLRGTATFVVLPGCGDGGVGPSAEGTARGAHDACESVQVLARRGHVAATDADRRAIYGELLATCADCHRKPRG